MEYQGVTVKLVAFVAAMVAATVITVPASSAPGTLLWSDPATWPGSVVPGPGDDVVIPSGTTVLLDVDTPALGDVVVAGDLVFDAQDLSLTARSILVQGSLTIGTESSPHLHEATITLTGTDSNADIGMGMGTKLIGVGMGATLDLHGAPRLSWTHLAATAQPNATSITLAETVDWQAGDEVVITSTDYDQDHAEVRTITSVSGTVVSLDAPLSHRHWGTVQSYGGKTLDTRAEVGLLTHNILIQGDAASDVDGFGGHIMAMTGSTTRVSDVELFRLGQAGILGRYPFHWHQAGDVTGSYFRSSSIHHSFNRCVTVHDTNNSLVEEVVAFETFGHCFFFEDATETGNTMRANLGLGIREPEPGNVLIPSDDGYRSPSVFWISNPANHLIDNVAAGSEGTGFWYALPEHPDKGLTTTMWPRRTPLGTFSGNVSHSNDVDGLHVDHGDNDGATSTETTHYKPLANPADPDSDLVPAVFEDFTAFANRNRGVWTRGTGLILRDARLADNLIAATFAAHESYLEDSLVVGSSAANPAEAPRPWSTSSPVQGFEFYDGTVGVTDTHFAGFVSNGTRPAGALTQLRHTDFRVSPSNHVSGLTFSAGTNAVWLETRPVPYATEDGEDGYRSTVFEDRDGSVTGTAGNHVVVNNSFLTTAACSFLASWGAWNCNEDYVGLSIYNRDYPRGDIANVVLTREDGRSHSIVGTPGWGPNSNFHTSLLRNRTYQLRVGGALPDEFQLLLKNGQPGEWLIVELAGNPGYAYPDWWIDSRNDAPVYGSLAALQAGAETGIYSSGSTTYVKLFVESGRDWASLHLCRVEECGEPDTLRLSGATRYATAGAVSAAAFDAADTVYVATGSNFPDALAAGAAAGAAAAPVLLVEQGSVPPQTVAELDRLDPDTIYVVGGTGAISAGVASQLSDHGSVVRLAGADRFATAVEVSKQAFPGGASTVVVATGLAFPDALAGAAYAGSSHGGAGPVLLTNTNVLPGVTRSEINRLRPDTIVVLGGTAAVSAEVEAELAGLADVVRVFGADRYATNRALTEYGYGNVDRVYVAVGTNFPDALAVSSAAAVEGVPVLLVQTASIPSPIHAALAHLDPEEIVIVGGEGVITESVRSSLDLLLGG